MLRKVSSSIELVLRMSRGSPKAACLINRIREISPNCHIQLKERVA